MSTRLVPTARRAAPLALAALVAGLPATGAAHAQEPASVASAGMAPEVYDELADDGEQTIKFRTPYYDGGRVVGAPGDIEIDLDTSFPKPDSIVGSSLVPSGWFAWKEQLYEDHGVKLAFSYQSTLQRASRSLGQRTAWGGWAQLEGKWEAVNRGEDYEGGVVFDLDWRHRLGGKAAPAASGFTELGSIRGTDVAFFEWDPHLVALYWDQWIGKETLNLRVGKQLAANSFDFFRFKDARTSFSSPSFTAAPSIPAPAFGYGATFKWWPQKGQPHYVVGTINDMNGNPTDYSLNTLFDESEFFYGLEIGTFWRRAPLDFDHLHLNLFYADRRSTSQLPLPNEPGGGFKVAGSKQAGSNVAFGNYTFNTAEGGGLGVTFARHTVNAGYARLKPLGYRGEIGFGLTWMDPVNAALANEFGGELYWKMLVTPDLWITPGVQFIENPALSPSEDRIVVGQFKLRLFL